MDGRSKRPGKLYLLPAFDQVSGAAPLFHAWTDGQNYWYSILEKEVQYEHDLEIRWNTDKNCLGKNIEPELTNAIMQTSSITIYWNPTNILRTAYNRQQTASLKICSS